MAAAEMASVEALANVVVVAVGLAVAVAGATGVVGLGLEGVGWAAAAAGGVEPMVVWDWAVERAGVQGAVRAVDVAAEADRAHRQGLLVGASEGATVGAARAAAVMGSGVAARAAGALALAVAAARVAVAAEEVATEPMEVGRALAQGALALVVLVAVALVVG